MGTPLIEGLYEHLVTRALEGEIERAAPRRADVATHLIDIEMNSPELANYPLFALDGV